ncbi:hypothetical protein ABZ621_36655 [Streptomyces sp. NPDC007863]|uniref:hypothetical protein n=1 Tax=Streptomyces sp. NPDC007863 TaxID=3154894 RepID=UPI0033CB19C0
MTQKPQPAEVAQALVEALQGQRPAIVCYAQCEPCQWGQCYDEPTPHSWAGPEDIEHAQATGQPEPTGTCACSCARTGDPR